MGDNNCMLVRPHAGFQSACNSSNDRQLFGRPWETTPVKVYSVKHMRCDVTQKPVQCLHIAGPSHKFKISYKTTECCFERNSLVYLPGCSIIDNKLVLSIHFFVFNKPRLLLWKERYLGYKQIQSVGLY